MSINVDEIALTGTDHKVVKIARSAFQRIQMNPKEHQLKSLGRSTLAWGAVAAPFCLLGDLVHGHPGPQEIKVL